MPETYFCLVPALDEQNWSHEEIRELAIPGGLSVNQSCEVYQWDYNELATMSFDDAKLFLKDKPKPSTKSCFDMREIESKYAFHYEQEKDFSFVPEWNLVCERTAMKSNVQVALSIGKFIGASTFGIVSDKFVGSLKA